MNMLNQGKKLTQVHVMDVTRLAAMICYQTGTLCKKSIISKLMLYSFIQETWHIIVSR